MKLIFKILSIISILFFISGCTSKITSENIQIQTNNFTNQYPHTVSVNTDGGKEKDVLGLQNISNENLKKAVSESIIKSQLFKEVVSTNPDFNLELFVVKVGQPVAGSTMTVNIEIAWALKKDNKIVWKKSIISSASKTMSDFASAYNRLVEATISATQKNIKLGLQSISNLNLK